MYRGGISETRFPADPSGLEKKGEGLSPPKKAPP